MGRLSHHLPAEAGMGGGCSDAQVLGWGALAVTDPDTGTVFEDEPFMELTIRQIFRVSLKAGFSRRLPACTPEKATPVQPLGHLGEHG